MKTIEDKWYDFLVDNEIATEDEISLVTNICGYNEDTMERILYAKTGLRSVIQALMDGYSDQFNEDFIDDVFYELVGNHNFDKEFADPDDEETAREEYGSGYMDMIPYYNAFRSLCGYYDNCDALHSWHMSEGCAVFE